MRHETLKLHSSTARKPRCTYCNAHDLHALEMTPPQNEGQKGSCASDAVWPSAINSQVSNHANPKSLNTVTCHPGMQSSKSAHQPPHSTFVVTLTPYRCSLPTTTVEHQPRGIVSKIMTHGATLDVLKHFYGLHNSLSQGVGWKNAVQTKHPINSPFGTVLSHCCLSTQRLLDDLSS